MAKINFAVTELRNDYGDRTIFVRGIVKKTDIPALEALPLKRFAVKGDFHGETGQPCVAGAQEHQVQPSANVYVEIEDYSNYTLAFAEATGILLDGRFV